MSNAAPCYVNKDGISVYRASALYNCQNALLMWRLGYEGAAPPERMQGRFDIGHTWEPIILEELRYKFGFQLFGFQDEADMKVGKSVMIRGHLDALHPPGEPITVNRVNGDGDGTNRIIIKPSELVVIDAKALARSGYEKWIKDSWKSAPYYAWQQAFYMDVFGAESVVMAVKNKEDDRLLVDYWTRDAVPVRKADYINKVLHIEKLSEQGETAIFAEKCAPKQYPCPFYFLHPQEEQVTIKDGDVVGGLDQIAELAPLHAAAVEAEKKAKAEKERLNGLLTKLYQDKVGTASLPDYTVSTYHHTSSQTDWDALAKALGVTVDKAKESFTSQVESNKLSVRVTAKGKKK